MFAFNDTNTYLVYLIALAGLLHACLQLPSASLLHMLTSTMGRNDYYKAVRLTVAMALGVALTTGVLLMLFSLLASLPYTLYSHLISGSLVVFSGLFVMLRYFRNDQAAGLWVPRTRIRWLHKKIESIGNVPSAFGLGIVTILTELVVSFPLLLAAGSLLTYQEATVVATGFLAYVGLATLPVLVFGISVACGISPARLQRWRSDGKHFWQFFIGLAMICYGLYIASEQFIGNGI
ncbi:MAG TPA: hypothetical protein VFZ58_02655 [Candidatus Saccharimonadales bacterium]